MRKIQELRSKGKKPAQIYVTLVSNDVDVTEDDVNHVVACLDQANRTSVASPQGWTNPQSVKGVSREEERISNSCKGNLNQIKMQRNQNRDQNCDNNDLII